MAGAALVATVALAPTTASAQSSVGSLTGKTAANSAVTITDTETGNSRTITSSSNGDFAVSALPPGDYKVTAADGSTTTVEVKAGIGASVTFGQADTVVIRGNRSVNPIDVKSTESTSIFTAKQLSQLPVGRDISSVALLAPGTVKNGSPANFGNLVSIGGSSVAENGYYINGFDVTNIRTFLSYADLPFDAIGQEQVKTGGYGAEFGRSLGGVISLVTKRGTNTWKFGGSVVWNPANLKMPGKDVLTNDPAQMPDPNNYKPEDDLSLYNYRSDNRSGSLTWTEYAGGPLIEDKLFLFAALQGQDSFSDTYGRTSSEHIHATSPSGMVKLDWYLNSDHHFEYTGIRNRSADQYTDYANATDDDGNPLDVYSGRHEIQQGDTYHVINGGAVDILKYTGHLTDNFTVSAQVGKLTNASGYTDPSNPDPVGAQCVAAYDSTASASSLNKIGCWNESQFTINDINFQPDQDERKALRLDAEWTLGNHDIRFGYDKEQFSSSHQGQTYSGGAYYRYYKVTEASRKVNGVVLPNGTTYVRKRIYGTNSSEYLVENSAWYLEDNWQITPNVIVYGGLRSESFVNKNGDGVPFVNADNALAPRLGATWDVNGDGTFKIFGSAGRYYIPVATNSNIRASGLEFTQTQFFYDTGYDTTTGAPIGLGAQIGATGLNGSMSPPDPRSVADNDLSPMYQDEFIVGAQKKLSDGLTLGVRSIFREVKSGMDDHCSKQPYQDWADANGFGSTIDLDSIASCVILNPGQDVTLLFDANGDGTSEVHTVGAEYYGLPAYKRTYASVEAFGEWHGANWSLNGSYTLSFSKGNVEGYVNTSLGQVDAGLTQDFDNTLFEDGADGYLPNDRRHSLKLFGTYKLNEEVSFAGNLLVQSGRPRNCLGYIDLEDPRVGIDSGALGPYAASSFHCQSGEGAASKPSQRGDAGRTDWTSTIDATIAYTPAWANSHVTFKADVFNLLNSQTVLTYQESSQSGSASDPSYNKNYGNITGYQTPRSVRFSILYGF